MLASERKNSIVSSTICGPARRRTAQRNIEAAAFVTLANVRWPIVRARYTGWLRKPIEPVGRLEQVDGVTRRRRVDDHEIPLAARVQFVEPLDRHVLLRARQRPRDRPVDRVAEQRLGLLRARRLLAYEPVERRRRVEHERPQLALARLADAGDVVRGVGRRARLQPECLGEPARRIDRDDDDAASGAGRRHPERRRGGGLADATGPAGDEQRRVVHGRGERPRARASTSPSDWAGLIGSPVRRRAATARPDRGRS